MRVQSLSWEDPWKRKRQPTPVFLPGKSHGQRSFTGYRSMGSHELATETTDLWPPCRVFQQSGPHQGNAAVHRQGAPFARSLRGLCCPTPGVPLPVPTVPARLPTPELRLGPRGRPRRMSRLLTLPDPTSAPASASSPVPRGLLEQLQAPQPPPLPGTAPKLTPTPASVWEILRPSHSGAPSLASSLGAKTHKGAWSERLNWIE